MAAGDERKALAQLDGLSASKLAPLPRLRLLRGQRRARLGDCEKALADFDALLAGASALLVIKSFLAIGPTVDDNRG